MTVENGEMRGNEGSGEEGGIRCKPGVICDMGFLVEGVKKVLDILGIAL